MLTSKKKPAPVPMIKMLCPAGKLVPRPPGPPGPSIPKERRFYNWPRDAKGNLIEDLPDFPGTDDIKEVTVEVPADHHHLVICIHKGPCKLADDAPSAAPVTAKKGGK
jgi:hypothetical protein